MRFGRCVLVACVLLFPALAQAQDFGVLESAVTINPGNFKLKVDPILILGDGDHETGVVAGVGYGFTDSFDFEAKLAFYDGVTLFGGDVKLWLLKNPHGVDLSVIPGFHFTKSDFGNQTGVDLTVVGSHSFTPKLDFYTAVDTTFNKYRDGGGSYTQVHVVPGIEYKISPDLHVSAEVGIALSDNGNNYISGGLAYYLR